MTKTVFRSAFLLGTIVLLLCATLFFGLQIRQTLDETFDALRQEAVYAEHGLMIGGLQYLESLDEVNRITWIDFDGSVLYDNAYTLPVANQLSYAEVTSALANGEGQSIHRSGSGGREAVYFAIRCEDGTVLRLSRPLSMMRYAFTSVSPVFWVLILVLMISALLSYRTAQQIVKPINNLDLSTPEAVPYPELIPLVNRIQEQKRTILEQAKEQESLRREFSANVSHELKTPLTSISGFAELMATGEVPKEKVMEFSSDIFQESQRMISLVEDIIRLSRLDEGNIQLQREPVDLYDLALETLESLRPAADSREVRLVLEGSSAVVNGIWQLLHEAVYNLCDNAIKYNRPGGTVTVRTFTDGGGKAVLSVADTGIGIAPEHQKRVFERFYRVDKSHSRAIGGTGLGLSIVKHVALFHDASVQLESTPDVGTVITLAFPE